MIASLFWLLFILFGISVCLGILDQRYELLLRHPYEKLLRKLTEKKGLTVSGEKLITVYVCKAKTTLSPYDYYIAYSPDVEGLFLVNPKKPVPDATIKSALELLLNADSNVKIKIEQLY